MIPLQPKKGEGNGLEKVGGIILSIYIFWKVWGEYRNLGIEKNMHYPKWQMAERLWDQYTQQISFTPNIILKF